MEREDSEGAIKGEGRVLWKRQCNREQGEKKGWGETCGLRWIEIVIRLFFPLLTKGPSPLSRLWEGLGQIMRAHSASNPWLTSTAEGWLLRQPSLSVKISTLQKQWGKELSFSSLSLRVSLSALAVAIGSMHCKHVLLVLLAGYPQGTYFYVIWCVIHTDAKSLIEHSALCAARVHWAKYWSLLCWRDSSMSESR